MIIIVILVKNEKKKSNFFEKTFILVEIIIDIIFGISFLLLSNVKIILLIKNLIRDFILLLKFY